ncbi:MAG: cyanoexosortase A system-associated protein [Microcoleaceae cyanobacterium]
MIWKQLRLPLLAFTGSLVFLVLGRVAVVPKVEATAEVSLNFPQDIPLENWQSVKNISPTNFESPLPKADQSYYYQKSTIPLAIEMRLLRSGDAEWFIEKKYGIYESSLVLRQQDGIGSYALFIYRERAYLSTCIVPWGGSTFTREEYTQSQALKGISWQRVMPWLMGQAPLREQGCLWAHLSVPLENLSPEVAYSTLENTWFSWYEWWSFYLSSSQFLTQVDPTRQ